ncbi:MAG: DUF4175 family protein, partial [Bacteroidota bacterium]
LAAIVALGGLALVSWLVLRPVLRLMGVLRSFDNFTLAEGVGALFPNVRDRLLNLLQLHREITDGTSLYSPELIDASFQDLGENIRGLDFRQTVNRSIIGRSAQWFALTSVGVVLLIAGLHTPLFGAADRLLHFTRDYIRPAQYQFEVYPGNQEVVKGASVEVSVLVHSATAEPIPANHLQLQTRLEGQARFEEARLRPDSAGIFRALLSSIRGNTDYYVQLEDVQSAMFRLSVTDRPVLKSVQVRLDYPAYTKLPPRMQEEFVGDVTALAGTRVSLRGAASKSLKSGRIVFGDGASLPLALRGEQFSASFSLKSETTYFVEIQDTEELVNLDPIKYRLNVIPDEAPTIAVTQPGRNVDVAGKDALPLVVQVKDDFGFSRLRVGYKLIHSRYEQPAADYTFLSLPLPSESGTQFEVPYRWDLRKLSLVPEDVVEYFAEVFDNDVVSGPKSARSQMYL